MVIHFVIFPGLARATRVLSGWWVYEHMIACANIALEKCACNWGKRGTFTEKYGDPKMLMQLDSMVEIIYESGGPVAHTSSKGKVGSCAFLAPS